MTIRHAVSPLTKLLLLAGCLLLPGCVQLTLAWADLNPRGPEARPDVLGAFEQQAPVTTPAQWREERVPALQAALQDHVYGWFPDASSARVTERRVVSDSAFGDKAIVEEWRVEATATFGDAAPATAAFNMVVVLPKEATGPVPVILMETFCASHTTVPVEGVTKPEGRSACDGGRMMNSVFTYIFGRYISTPPLDRIVERGYALATVYPSEYVPDSATSGQAALERLSAGYTDDETRWGSIAAWAWGFSRMIDVLEEDARFDRDGMVLYGHSRYGKSALVGAAFDERVDGVITHQSGTGGAALNRDKPGETVGDITNSYPHWFSKTYASYEGREGDMPVDQHQLLALVAPRPILIGNARRDVWSDPTGSFLAAKGADAAYGLLGSDGLEQESLKAFIPSADLSFWIRPGTHGVTEEDWPVFLEFLDAHFQ
jgi:hypothetical protein